MLFAGFEERGEGLLDPGFAFGGAFVGCPGGDEEFVVAPEAADGGEGEFGSFGEVGGRWFGAGGDGLEEVQKFWLAVREVSEATNGAGEPDGTGLVVAADDEARFAAGEEAGEFRGGFKLADLIDGVGEEVAEHARGGRVGWGVRRDSVGEQVVRVPDRGGFGDEAGAAYSVGSVIDGSEVDVDGDAGDAEADGFDGRVFVEDDEEVDVGGRGPGAVGGAAVGADGDDRVAGAQCLDDGVESGGVVAGGHVRNLPREVVTIQEVGSLGR